MENKSVIIKPDGKLYKLARVIDEERELNRLKVRGLIARKAFNTDMKGLEMQRVALEMELNIINKAAVQINKTITIEELTDELVSRVIKKVIVLDWTVTFVFYNGVEISREYSNGKPGNQVGWADRKRLKEKQNGYDTY